MSQECLGLPIMRTDRTRVLACDATCVLLKCQSKGGQATRSGADVMIMGAMPSIILMLASVPSRSCGAEGRHVMRCSTLGRFRTWSLLFGILF